MDAMSLLPVIGYDCESTGTDVARDRVISAAIVRRDADGTVTSRAWLINPGVEIPAAAQAVHGLSTEHVRAHGASPLEALDEIATQLADALTEGLPIVIYNAPYDLGMLDAELGRHALPTLVDRLGRPVHPVIDPLVLDRGVDRYRKGKRTLPDLIATYRLPPATHSHDATDDVINTIAVLDAIMARHPELPADLAALHSWQAARHAEWATSFNDWLRSQGRPATVDTRWP